MLKPGALTSSATEAVATTDPDVPVIVSRYDPRTAELPTASLSTLVVDVGLLPHDAVTPLGKPVTESSTLPVNPP